MRTMHFTHPIITWAPPARPTAVAALLLSLMLLYAGSGRAQDAEVSVGSARFQVELARTPEQRSRGLMFRRELAAGHGMLFINEQPRPSAFWMRNTLISLDLLYFDADRRLREIFAGVPPCTTQRCPTYASSGPVKYVLEINAGTAARLGIQPGDELSLNLPEP